MPTWDADRIRPSIPKNLLPEKSLCRSTCLFVYSCCPPPSAPHISSSTRCETFWDGSAAQLPPDTEGPDALTVEVFTGPLGSENPRSDPRPERVQVQNFYEWLGPKARCAHGRGLHGSTWIREPEVRPETRTGSGPKLLRVARTRVGFGISSLG